jgi:hypothetical protein
MRGRQTAAYHAWFRDQVVASIDDPRPSLDHREVRKRFAAMRAALSKSARGATKAVR